MAKQYAEVWNYSSDKALKIAGQREQENAHLKTASMPGLQVEAYWEALGAERAK